MPLNYILYLLLYYMHFCLPYKYVTYSFLDDNYTYGFCLLDIYLFCIRKGRGSSKLWALPTLLALLRCGWALVSLDHVQKNSSSSSRVTRGCSLEFS